LGFLIIRETMSSSTLNDKKDYAVKALIYREDGKILLQKRDNNQEIDYPGCWNLFGGLVKDNESLDESIQRELIEELTILPGKIGEKVFKWMDQEGKILNICFSICFSVKESDLHLKEGETMRWFKLSSILNLNMTGFLKSNLHNLIIAMDKIKPGIQSEFEKECMNNLGLLKKNIRVYYTKNKPACFNSLFINTLTILGQINNIPLIRLCLHENDDENIHEMLMIHIYKQKVGPLKQNKNSSLSYHVISGAGKITLHNEKGTKNNEFIIDANNPNGYRHCRLKANTYRTIESTTNNFVFLEISSGPFKDSDTIWLKKTLERIE